MALDLIQRETVDGGVGQGRPSYGLTGWDLVDFAAVANNSPITAFVTWVGA